MSAVVPFDDLPDIHADGKKYWILHGRWSIITCTVDGKQKWWWALEVPSKRRRHPYLKPDGFSVFSQPISFNVSTTSSSFYGIPQFYHGGHIGARCVSQHGESKVKRRNPSTRFVININRVTTIIPHWQMTARGDMEKGRYSHLQPRSLSTVVCNGSFKKKCQQNCSSVFCWSLLLFYSDKVHK